MCGAHADNRFLIDIGNQFRVKISVVFILHGEKCRTDLVLRLERALQLCPDVT